MDLVKITQQHLFVKKTINLFYLFLILALGFFLISVLAACRGSESFLQSLNSSGIKSGSLIISSNNNGTTGPGLISVWNPDGSFDRILYDYAKTSIGSSSGHGLLPNGSLLSISDTGGSASNDFLDLFNYNSPMANPINLFSTLVSGAATTYMRQMAFVDDQASGKYLVFAAEQGSNRVARLSSFSTTTNSALNFTRDFNVVSNGTCVITTPYGVAYIPTTNNIAIIFSAASGRVNIVGLNGVCVGSTAITNTPTGVTYHSVSNKILVTYFGNSSISAHDVATGAASPATAIFTSAGLLNGPRAIASDKNGFIYVGSDGSDQILKLYWDGVTATATYVGVAISSSIFTQNITAITVVP